MRKKVSHGGSKAYTPNAIQREICVHGFEWAHQKYERIEELWYEKVESTYEFTEGAAISELGTVLPAISPGTTSRHRKNRQSSGILSTYSVSLVNRHNSSKVADSLIT